DRATPGSLVAARSLTGSGHAPTGPQASRIVHVTLAARHVLHMRGIRQDQREPPFQNVPDRLPVHARRFHRHVRASRTLQPLGNRQYSLFRRRETAHLPLHLALADKAQTGHHLHLVHVETRAPLMQRLHRHLPRARPARSPCSSNSTYRVPGSALPTWAAASIDDNNGCSKVLRSNSFTGSLARSNTDLLADRTTS